MYWVSILLILDNNLSVINRGQSNNCLAVSILLILDNNLSESSRLGAIKDVQVSILLILDNNLSGFNEFANRAVILGFQSFLSWIIIYQLTQLIVPEQHLCFNPSYPG